MQAKMPPNFFQYCRHYMVVIIDETNEVEIKMQHIKTKWLTNVLNENLLN